MFDQKTNMPDNSELTPLEPQNPLAADLPSSNQPKVTPKFNSTSISGLGAQDMFSETEDEDKEANVLPAMPSFKNIIRPAATPNLASMGPQEPLSELPDDVDAEPDGKKKYIWIGVAVLAILVFGGGYFAYSKFLAGGVKVPNLNLNISPEEFNKRLQEEVIDLNLNQPVFENSNENQNINENINVNLNEDNNVNVQINADINLDSDKDGLTDEEEKALGTNINATDTDGDGLFDYEEIKTYLTKPLIPDSDNDGYLDGQEVRGGYNPNGPGKILEANFN